MKTPSPKVSHAGFSDGINTGHKRLTGLHGEAGLGQLEACAAWLQVEEDFEGLPPPHNQTLVSVKIRAMVAVVALYVQITALHV